MQKFLSPRQKFHVCSRGARMNFKNTFGSALRSRLAPNTALHPKVLASALGCDTQSIYNHMNGRNAPDGAALQGYIGFFSERGDVAFITEIFPGITPLVQRRKEADDALVLVRGLAKFAQGVAA
jgi:hypothetical protein